LEKCPNWYTPIGAVWRSAPIGIHLLGQFQEVPQLLYTYWGSFTNAPNSVDGNNTKFKCLVTNSNKVKNNKLCVNNRHKHLVIKIDNLNT
jgi:hypothetical protein